MRLARGLMALALIAPVLGGVSAVPAAAATSIGDVVPVPVSVAPAPGVTYTLPSTGRIHADTGATAVADRLAGLLRPSTGYALPVLAASGTPTDGIALLLSGADPSVGQEGYQLDVTAAAVTIRAKSAAGLFHGVQTLRQLLPVAVESATPQAGPWVVPGGRIIDYPRFAYRGAMLDVARHFQPVATVKRYIDQLALYKINYLHLHLTDDQGWRIVVDSWPRLATHGGSTQVGGGPGGYYTKAQYADIVAYAAARHIAIVPEIDMPGHTNAALASYAELNCDGVARQLYTGTAVGFSSLCVPKEITYTFINDVIRELSALSPGPYVHLGGDETAATSPADFTKFIERVQPIVTGNGRAVIGWHEIGSTAHSAGRVVQYWGTATSDSHVTSAVSKGAKVLMSPANKTYLDMKYNSSTPIGLSWAGYIEVRTAYDWNPGAHLTGVGESSVLGVEAPLWSETVVTQNHIDYLTFPRLPAIAEVGWSPWSTHNWDAFRLRLAAQGPRWSAMGIDYYPSTQIPWPSTGSAKSLVGQASGRCLDIPASNMANGTQPALWDCHGGANQKWTHTTASELRATVNGVTKCLDVNGGSTADGAVILLWDCHGGGNQKWTFNAAGQVVGQQSGKCLEPAGGATANGTAIRLATCRTTNNASQVFART
ncbi:hexosaminidase [Actinokineospora alba]|uniref:beta-N-acetylhexosaminidase n=1 Tax=Actinokineospora alba TaxID=504798 RepID=A0A1H0FF48_9PSEU|nr:family 20 glycosylhydrolase [Actinokineospora alba]TDP69447.1 hexosaminidase [Actinokineospora alba]SDI16624.1 hexosaminidase [Actinokineospora alba]SDN93019.1 hexosaminidase [Actinokineospora alba]